MTPIEYSRALGARLLSEANDVKRTPDKLAEEMGLSQSHIQAAIAGRLKPEEYRVLFQAVSQRYPIAFSRLWIEPADTECGVLHMTAEESKASSRIFARPDRTGQRAPYYEYRDTAFSRTAPFRPEWIRELRVVQDSDPHNPDVAFNKGHFLHQTTLFIGPVNFYWEVNGKRHVMELNTGDSNYITPFWPHSFTSRDASKPAFILAVTYGGEVARAREELARMGGSAVPELALDVRHEAAAYAGLLRRHLTHETLPVERFTEACAKRRMDPDRIAACLDGRTVPTAGEIMIMVDVLCVMPRDLMPPTRVEEDEVVVLRRAQAEMYAYPDAGSPCYEITRLARSRQQPCLKSFLIRVLPARKAQEFRLGLHQYLYNHGEEAVQLLAHEGNAEREIRLAPGDSAYIAPMTTCRFEASGPRPGELYLVRVPGDLHPDAVFELSGMAPDGVTRAAHESTSWF